MKNQLNYIKKHYRLVLKEANKLILRKRKPNGWCHSKCISCLVADARSKVDEDFDIGFTMGDVSMLMAIDYFAKKLVKKGWEVR